MKKYMSILSASFCIALQADNLSVEPMATQPKENTLQTNAITYALDKDAAYTARLGDNLLRYAHARWVAYKYKIPLVYKPFPYSSMLALSKMHSITTAQSGRFSKIMSLKKPADIQGVSKGSNTLYVLPKFFLEIAGYRHGTWSTFDIDWDNKGFLETLKAEIKPRKALRLVSIPQGRVSVAVHMRKGGGYDHVCQVQETRGCADRTKPLRFPPDSYYVEQIRKISLLVNKAPLYVHIFTDDPDPATLVKKFKEELKDERILFGYRARGNHHEKNVLEDLFSMVKFDCFIRSESFFSFIAAALGDFKIVIKPTRCHWRRRKLYIDGVTIEQKK